MLVTQCGVNLWVQWTECGLQSVMETNILCFCCLGKRLNCYKWSGFV